MRKKGKNNSNVPKHKRLKKSARLQIARDLMYKYDGENLVKWYSKHFAVDKLCAVNELSLLGCKIKDEYVEQLKRSIESQRRINQKSKELMEEKLKIETYEDYEEIYQNGEEYLQESMLKDDLFF